MATDFGRCQNGDMKLPNSLCSQVARLSKGVTSVAPYPAGVIALSGFILGVAFFPGGSGLWDQNAPSAAPRMPIGGTMVLGHDFHSETGFKNSLTAGTENVKSPTWRNLLRLLGDAGLDLRSCFFTNFFMGLRKGKQSTGVFPGRGDAEFLRRCQEFFLTQLSI